LPQIVPFGGQFMYENSFYSSIFVKLSSTMETYANILMVASPIFFLFVFGEKLYGFLRFGHDFKLMDMLSSLSSGFTNALKDVLGLGVTLLSYEWLVTKMALFHIPYTWVNVVLAFVAIDFSGYWGHRINHQNNFFWNQHIIHHSSEEFNLACALRQSISNFVNFFTIFLLPAALLGVDFKIISIVAPLHLFAQFWYHTVYINKMGWLEKIIVTPSHHRVHHAINPIYIDKNHGQIFIFWDKMFGTFQEELASEPPVYGITVPAQTWNPIKINFKHLWLMIKDSYHTSSWADRLKIWWGPTGFRPADVDTKFPVFKINNPHQYQKYSPQVSTFTQYWALLNFLVTFIFLMHFYYSFGQASYTWLLGYGLFLFMCVYSYTELMDGNPAAWLYDLAKNIFGAILLSFQGFWFVPGQAVTIAVWLYFIGCTIVGLVLLPKQKLNNA
jgi:alkylglycerol monooxygenase